MKYCGIDLHSNNSVVVVSDEEDRIVFSKRLPNDMGQIREALEQHREELTGLVIESTYNWYWLVDGLMAVGYRVHLAHPSAIKKYEGLKHSGDFADAAYLAQLLRLGLLAEGYIYPREERGVRDLARKRMQLVRYRTAQILSIENIVTRQTGARLKGEAVKRLTAEQVDEFAFAPDVALAVEANRAVSQALGQQIEALERRLKERVSLRPEYRLLKTVPGIGETLATTIMLETGASVDLRKWGISAPTAAAWTVCGKAMARRRGKATARTGTSISPGRLWRRRTSLCATVRKPGAFMIVKRARRIASWRSRLWRTNWRGPATTCCETRSPSM